MLAIVKMNVPLLGVELNIMHWVKFTCFCDGSQDGITYSGSMNASVVATNVTTGIGGMGA